MGVGPPRRGIFPGAGLRPGHDYTRDGPVEYRPLLYPGGTVYPGRGVYPSGGTPKARHGGTRVLLGAAQIARHGARHFRRLSSLLGAGTLSQIATLSSAPATRMSVEVELPAPAFSVELGSIVESVELSGVTVVIEL